jgi:hypothetical protein
MRRAALRRGGARWAGPGRRRAERAAAASIRSRKCCGVSTGCPVRDASTEIMRGATAHCVEEETGKYNPTKTGNQK